MTVTLPSPTSTTLVSQVASGELPKVVCRVVGRMFTLGECPCFARVEHDPAGVRRTADWFAGFLRRNPRYTPPPERYLPAGA